MGPESCQSDRIIKARKKLTTKDKEKEFQCGEERLNVNVSVVKDNMLIWKTNGTPFRNIYSRLTSRDAHADIVMMGFWLNVKTKLWGNRERP